MPGTRGTCRWESASPPRMDTADAAPPQSRQRELDGSSKSSTRRDACPWLAGMGDHACRMRRSVRTWLLRGRTATGRPGRPRRVAVVPCVLRAAVRTHDLPRDGTSGVNDVGERALWHRRAEHGRGLAGRARIVRRGRGRWLAALPHRSMVAWSGAPQARRCRVLRKAGGKD